MKRYRVVLYDSGIPKECSVDTITEGQIWAVRTSDYEDSVYAILDLQNGGTIANRGYIDIVKEEISDQAER